MSKILVFIYGIVAYVVALIGQVWFILYLGEWEFMAETINSSQILSLSLSILNSLDSNKFI